LAPTVRRWLRRPEPVVKTPSLKTNLEKMFQDTAKQAKKAKAAFESNIKPERREGPDDERTAMNFSWTGAGRGQGKIWYCAQCHRVVIAQVVGLSKDQSAIATLHDHSEGGFDLWALYDLQVEIPEDFRLLEQKLLSGYLSLTFGRHGEKIILDRWGLANMTLKKFKLDDWFQNNVAVNLKRTKREEVESERGHAISHFSGGIPLLLLARMLRDTVGSMRRFPTRYEGGVWHCTETNKIFALQTLRSKKSESLWQDVVDRLICHTGAAAES
jgi:ribosomal protein L37AE/L43A